MKVEIAQEELWPVFEVMREPLGTGFTVELSQAQLAEIQYAFLVFAKAQIAMEEAMVKSGSAQGPQRFWVFRRWLEEAGGET